MTNKLVYRFLFFGLPLLVFSLFAISAALLWSNYAHLEKTIRQDYENIVRVAASEIRFFAADAVVNLEALAGVIEATKLDEWGKLMAMRAFRHKEKRFAFLALYSAEGERLVGDEEEESSPFDGFGEKHRERLLSGETETSAVRFGDAGIPFIHIAVPLRHLGKTSSVLVGKLSLKKLWDVLDEIAIGRTGHVSILDGTGRYVGHLEMDRVVTSAQGAKPDILEKIRSAPQPVEWRENHGGRTFYKLGLHIPELDWIVLLYQRLSEIHGHFHRSLSVAAGITLFVCLFAAFFYWRWFEWMMDPIRQLTIQARRISDGDLEKGVSVASLDEIGELASAFNVMIDSLKRKIANEKKITEELFHGKNLAILGAASSMVNHEVGNFLNKLNMVTRSLKSEPLSESTRELVALIGEESENLDDFIEKFMDVARKRELKLVFAEFGIIVDDVVKFRAPLAAEKNIRVETEGFDGLPEAMVDLYQMRAALDNLVKNAIEAIVDGGVVVVRGSSEEGLLEVRVSDDGPGMDEETASKLFEPFFTTKGGKGNGLGLPLVKNAVEAHGGEIRCETTLGEGTAFVLRLPLKPGIANSE